MINSKIYLSLKGNFEESDIRKCFKAKPSKLLIRGDKNSGGKVMTFSLASFILSECKTDDLYSSLEESFEELSKLLEGVVSLRNMKSVDSCLQIVLNGMGNADPLPSLGLEVKLLNILAKSNTSFDVDMYITN